MQHDHPYQAPVTCDLRGPGGRPGLTERPLRPGDLSRALAAGAAGARGGELVGVHHGRPAADAALGSRGLQPGHGPHLHLVPLELGERVQDREEQLARAGRLVVADEREVAGQRAISGPGLRAFLRSGTTVRRS